MMIGTTDETLLKNFIAGSQSAFAELHSRHSPGLTKYLRGRFFKNSSDPSVVEDIAQHAFLKLSEQASVLDLDEPIQAWLYRVATNKAVDTQRARQRRPAVSLQAMRGNDNGDFVDFDLEDEKTDTAFEHMASEEDRAEVREVLAMLPEADRKAVEAIYFQGMTWTEAAAHLGMPSGSLKTRVHRSLTTMRCRIGGRREAEAA